MRTWSYSINSLPQFKYGTLHLEEMPWYVSLIETVNDRVCYLIGTYLAFDFPNILHHQWDKDDSTYNGSLKEWFGGPYAMWHIYICSPIFDWCWKHPKRKSYDFDLGYDAVKKIMYEHDKKFFDESEKINNDN